MNAHRVMALCFVLILLGILFAMQPLPARANSMLVDTLDDVQTIDGFCSLREAMLNAKFHDQSGSTECAVGDPDSNTITFGVAGTIVLSSTLGSLPSISNTLTINGPGADLLTISGNNLVRVMAVNDIGALNLSGVRIANGNISSGAGGGIRNNGILTVTNTTFFSNTVTDPAGNGGAIRNLGPGTLTIINSTFISNSAPAGNSGGAISNNAGTLVITGTNFYGNSAQASGGAITSFGGGTVTITGSTFSGNGASSTGGAISHSGGPLSIVNSSLYTNTSSSTFPVGSRM